MENSDGYQMLLTYALNLLARRWYTVRGLTQKLEKHAAKMEWSSEASEPPDSAIPRVISRLKELTYLNDYDYAKRWVEERCRLKPRGKYLLNQELQRKGIPKAILEQFWEKETLDERILAGRLIEQRLPRLKNVDSPYERHQKLYRFLTSRGFSSDTIRDALDRANILG